LRGTSSFKEAREAPSEQRLGGRRTVDSVLERYAGCIRSGAPDGCETDPTGASKQRGKSSAGSSQWYWEVGSWKACPDVRCMRLPAGPEFGMPSAERYSRGIGGKVAMQHTAGQSPSRSVRGAKGLPTKRGQTGRTNGTNSVNRARKITSRTLSSPRAEAPHPCSLGQPLGAA
jgi:hypothetical protein